MRMMLACTQHLISFTRIPLVAGAIVGSAFLVVSVAVAQSASPCDSSALCRSMYSVIATRKGTEVQNLIPVLAKTLSSLSEAEIRRLVNEYQNAEIADHISQRFGYGLSSAARSRTLRGVTDTILKGWLFDLAQVVESPPTSMTNPELARMRDAFDVTTQNFSIPFNPVKDSVVEIYTKFKSLNDGLELGVYCNDGWDNDRDGLKDSADTSCNGTSNLNADQTVAERAKIYADLDQIRFWPGEYGGRFRALISAFGSERTIGQNWSDTQSNFASLLEETLFNHFNVDYTKGRIDFGLGAGGYEPMIHSKMFGTFFELLKGVIWHPAMLYYLDNDANRYDLVAKRASNQNLGRELLELHTLGLGPNLGWRKADGSVQGKLYTQTDVENSALLLTGLNVKSWTSFGSQINYLNHVPADSPPVVMGQKFCVTPLENPAVIGAGSACPTADAKDLTDATKITNAITMQLDNYLRFLANHERTTINICTKLVSRFVGQNYVPTGVDDDPSTRIDESQTEVQRSAVVSRCISSWGRDGDLKALYRAILTSSETWAATNYNRLGKNPSDLVISAIRASGVTSNSLQTNGDIEQTNDLIRWLGSGLVYEMRYLGLPYRKWMTPTGYNELSGWMSQGYLVRWITSSFRLANFLESRSRAADPAREIYAPVMGIGMNGTLLGSSEASCRAQPDGVRRYEFLRGQLGYGDVRTEAWRVKTRTEAMLSIDPSYKWDRNNIWGANKQMVWQKIGDKYGPSCIKSALPSILASRRFLSK